MSQFYILILLASFALAFTILRGIRVNNPGINYTIGTNTRLGLYSILVSCLIVVYTIISIYSLSMLYGRAGPIL